MLFFLFFFFFFAYCGVLLLKVYWKAYLELFWPLDLEKNKNKAQMWHCSSHENYYTSGCWNFADFDLYIRGENRQTTGNKFGFSTV